MKYENLIVNSEINLPSPAITVLDNNWLIELPGELIRSEDLISLFRLMSEGTVNAYLQLIGSKESPNLAFYADLVSITTGSGTFDPGQSFDLNAKYYLNINTAEITYNSCLVN